MRCLVVGSGASVAEGLALGLSFEQCPPLVSNFASRLWEEFNPHPILDRFLASRGYVVSDRDGRPLFRELERNAATRGAINIERFFEFAWRHRRKRWTPEVAPDGRLPRDYIFGCVITSLDEAAVTINQETPTGWQNLLLHGLGSPLQNIIVTSFYENGRALRKLRVAQEVGSILYPGGAVVNLNYDTLFELGLRQAGISFSYAPNFVKFNEISVCKPHGSLNLVVDEREGSFVFGQPDWLGMPARPGTIPYSGLLPPRYNKSYERMPTAKMILAPLLKFRPQTLSFWGVGFTSSDVDLLEIYRGWSHSAEMVEVINPDSAVARAAEEVLYRPVCHYRDAQIWLSTVGA